MPEIYDLVVSWDAETGRGLFSDENVSSISLFRLADRIGSLRFPGESLTLLSVELSIDRQSQRWVFSAKWQRGAGRCGLVFAGFESPYDDLIAVEREYNSLFYPTQLHLFEWPR